MWTQNWGILMWIRQTVSETSEVGRINGPEKTGFFCPPLVPCSRGLSISVGFPRPRPHHNHRQYGRNNANSSCSRGLSKGWAKKIPVFSGPFIRPTSDVDFSETVCRIYIKITQSWVHISVPNLWNFYVNQTNRFREIDVGSWPNKWTGKNGTFFWPTLFS